MGRVCGMFYLMDVWFAMVDTIYVIRGCDQPKIWRPFPLASGACVSLVPNRFSRKVHQDPASKGISS